MESGLQNRIICNGEDRNDALLTGTLSSRIRRSHSGWNHGKSLFDLVHGFPNDAFRQEFRKQDAARLFGPGQ